MRWKRGVCISYDTRKNSKLFAKVSAGVLLANGIKVRIFNEPSPVPMLSTAVRYYSAIAGIMITASHNPKEYNGYKVYGEDGAQMSIEATNEVVSYMSKIKDVFSIEEYAISSLKPQGDLKIIGKPFLKTYIKILSKLALSKKAVAKCGKKLKIVYTPLHGTGYNPVCLLFKKLGIELNVVEEQTNYDSNFSTVEVPNPENAEALKMGIELANKINADVVFGTDPDADRLGVAIKNNKGEFINLTGNQVGVLLVDYILKRLSSENKLAKNGAIIKSFVSTNMVKPICEEYNVLLEEVPVGFKFIGEKIKKYEKTKEHTFLFGFEESCGYLRGTHARDKDSIVASMLFAEMCSYYQYNNISVFSVLEELYNKYGYYIDKTFSYKYEGITAMQDMEKAVDKIRNSKIDNIDVYNIIAVRDYSTGTRTTRNGESEKLEFSGINCIYYELEIGGFICVRPSGTEPKLKVYYSVKGKNEAQAQKSIEKLQEGFSKLL